MSSLDSFFNCLNERVAGGPFKLSKKISSSFRDGLISELYKNSGNLTLNNFLDFLKIFSVYLDDKNKKIIGDLEKPKDRKWWADVLGMDLERDINELIVRDYEAIFNPGKKRIMGFQIQGRVSGLKDCLNEELELKKPRDSPLSGVSSPDFSSEPETEVLSEQVYEPEPEYEHEKRIKIDGKWVTQSEALKLLQDPKWTKESLGLLRKKKKTKQTKKKRNKKKKKTKRRTKR